MIKLSQAVIVEGKYDKIKLLSVIDAPIFTTDGFGIFNNREKQCLLRRIAAERGIIILTDSDSAGFLIRSKLCSMLPPACVTNVYIPELKGKERRKRAPSKEGLLGVEGVDCATLAAALRRAGVVGVDESSAVKPRDELTKADLYELGLTGGQNSAARRKELLSALELPSKMSTSAMLSALNILTDRDELVSLCERLWG